MNSLPDTGGSVSGPLDDFNSIGAYGALAPGHQNEEPSFSINDFTYDFNFQQFVQPSLDQPSTANTSQEESVHLSDSGTPSSSHGKFHVVFLITRF